MANTGKKKKTDKEVSEKADKDRANDIVSKEKKEISEVNALGEKQIGHIKDGEEEKKEVLTGGHSIKAGDKKTSMSDSSNTEKRSTPAFICSLKRSIFTFTLLSIVIFIGYKTYILSMSDIQLRRQFYDASSSVINLKEEQKNVYAELKSIQDIIKKNIQDNSHKEALLKLSADIESIGSRTLHNDETIKTISEQFSELNARLEEIAKERKMKEEEEILAVDVNEGEEEGSEADEAATEADVSSEKESDIENLSEDTVDAEDGTGSQADDLENANEDAEADGSEESVSLSSDATTDSEDVADEVEDVSKSDEVSEADENKGVDEPLNDVKEQEQNLDDNRDVDFTEESSSPDKKKEEAKAVHIERKKVHNLSDNIVIDEKYKEGVDNFFNLIQYTCEKVSDAVHFIVKWVKNDGIKIVKKLYST